MKRIRKVRKTQLQLTVEEKTEILDLAKAISNRIKRNLSQKNLTYKCDIEMISEIISDHFLSYYKDYAQLKNVKLPNRLVIGAGNKTFIRLIARILKSREKYVAAFSHGEVLQNSDYHRIWLDIIISTNYFEQSKFLVEDLYSFISNDRFKALFRNSISYVGSNNTTYKDFVKLEQEYSSVLVVGNATKTSGFSNVTAFTPAVQVKIETRLFEYFHSLGKNVVYKPHPGGHLKNELLDLYRERNDVSFEFNSFEKILDNFDVIVFYYARTTTINAAFQSDKPIILVDLGIEKYQERSLDLLRNRCQIIPYEDLLEIQ